MGWRPSDVIPAKAGIQFFGKMHNCMDGWKEA